MIDPVSLVVGIVIGAVVGIGGGIWFVKRKLQKMQDDMFGQMGGMMQDPTTQQEEPDMEAVMGEMMNMMENPKQDDLELTENGNGDGSGDGNGDDVDWKN